ncbi:hypothetical protein [Glycomyces sp. NPDC048151]|uniref:hypothetical protein n=1 Tax=Glycomyces sp. NPDC048151 TaxID=3364002 RepID=UPI003715DBE1
MPSNRWLKRPASALRDLVIHAHMRADMLPRLPFVIALVVSAVALVVAVEHRSAADARLASVEELPSGRPEEYTDDVAFVEEEVELEIVETGFSKVVDRDGDESIIVAVVVRNPHDGELIPGSLAIQTETERGYPVDLDTMYIGSLPPFATAMVGYVMTGNVDAVDPADLTLRPTDPSMLYPSEYWDDLESGLQYEIDPLPTFTYTGIQPLVSPDGYRLHFTAETVDETDSQIAVLFRDGEGTLLGGVPADADLASGGFRTLPAGESRQFVDVTAEWIPEGADLDRIEIGPSRY